MLPLPKTDFKMLLSNFFLNCFTNFESSEINLPTEVWIHIWSFLDFNTCQKICSRVSKEWLYKIRNSTRLSGEMIFRLEKQSVKDINEINNALTRWPKLKVLHLSDCYCNCRTSNCNCSQLNKLLSNWNKLKEFTLTTEMFGINLTEHALLKKVVVQKSMPFEELGDWGKATQVWFDPKKWTPANLANVRNMTINVDFVPKTVEMLQIGQVLKNVEELYITEKISVFKGLNLDREFILGFKSFFLGFKKLTKVQVHVTIDINIFLDLLQSIASIKGIKFWLAVFIDHELEEKYVEGVFEEGFKIIEKTFSIGSTAVMICDSQYPFKIEKKYNKEPVLYDDEPYETSDDEELTEDDEDSSVE